MAALPDLCRRAGQVIAARLPKRQWLRWSLALAVLLFAPGLWHLARMSWQQRQLDRQLAALASEREQLQAEQQRLQTDPTYVESRIRSTFKVARPGEIVIPIDRRSDD